MIDVLPQQWNQVRLEAVCSMKTGVAFSPPDLVEADAAGAVACYRTSNVQEELDTNDVIFLPRTHVHERDYFLREGDILVSTANSNNLVGKCCFVPRLRNEAVFGGFISRLRVESSLLDSQFAYLWLASNPVQAHLRQRARQTTNIANLLPSDVLATEIPLPPLSEQKLIVKVLGEARAVRRLRRQADDLTNLLIPAIFNDMFGDPLSNPKGFDIKPLGDLFEMSPNYGTMVPAADTDDGIRCIRVGDIQGNELDLTFAGQVPRSDMNNVRHLVQAGDLVLVRAIGSIDHLGKSVIITEAEDGLAFDSHLMRVRFDRTVVYPDYVHSLFLTPGGRRLFLKNPRRSAVQVNINTAEYSRIRIPLPPLKQQLTFIERLTQVRTVRSATKQSAVCEAKLFASLLAQAFSGGLTTAWRKANRDKLAKEVAKRDAALKTAGVNLVKPVRSMIVGDVPTTGRYSELSREQRELLHQVRQAMTSDTFGGASEVGDAFTLDSMRDWLNEPLDDLPDDALRRHLEVLVARGVMKLVSRPLGVGVSSSGDSGGHAGYGNVYRLVREKASEEEESELKRMTELSRLARIHSRVVSDTLSDEEPETGD